MLDSGNYLLRSSRIVTRAIADRYTTETETLQLYLLCQYVCVQMVLRILSLYLSEVSFTPSTLLVIDTDHFESMSPLPLEFLIIHP